MLSRTPPLRAYPAGTCLPFGAASWEPHPDGAGGYWPIDPALRGNVELPCPHPDCDNTRLVRNGTFPLIRTTIFGCDRCHRPVVGGDVRVSADKTPEL